MYLKTFKTAFKMPNSAVYNWELCHSFLLILNDARKTLKKSMYPREAKTIGWLEPFSALYFEAFLMIFP